MSYRAAFSDWKLDGGKVPYGIFQVSKSAVRCVTGVGALFCPLYLDLIPSASQEHMVFFSLR